ncbi:MAG: DUF2848 family protein [Bacillota bacterium]|jgi:hypothetical protein
MLVLEFRLPYGENLTFPASKVINGGYTGRDAAAVQAHVEELEKEGIAPPLRTPLFFPVPRDRVTLAAEVEVVGENTSGEVEYVLLVSGDDLFVTVASDHTDRTLERVDMLASKALCPNVLAPVAWRYEEVQGHWDEIMIRSWIGEGRRTLRQEAPLAAIMAPGDLMAEVARSVKGPLEGVVILSGTVASRGEGSGVAGFFEFEMEDPRLGRRISWGYRITRTDWYRP